MFSAFVGFLVAIILFFSQQGWTQPTPETKAPIITNAYAIDKEQYGSILKIYIEADDPDGDMLRIASVVDQVGYGHYPTDWIYLKKEYGQHFKGYIQWNTFSSRASYITEWTRITLRVSVFDNAGNESNVVIFPFTFELVRGQYNYKLPSPFDQGDLPRLGYIGIDLFNPREGYDNIKIRPFRD